MAIDDEIDQARALIASDARRASPGATALSCLAKVCALIPGLELGAAGLESIADLYNRMREENLSYLLETVADRVQKLTIDVSTLSSEHQEFLRKDWTKLVLDGLNKAQQTRARARVARMGNALARAYREGDKLSPDLTEEMLRVCMAVDETDLLVLTWLCDGMKGSFMSQTGQVDHESVNNFWGNVDRHGYTHSRGEAIPPQALAAGDLMSACAKLQAYGLVIQVRQNPSKVSPATLPYGPLRKAYDFLDYVRIQSEGAIGGAGTTP
jgi:hypothetical protein